MSHSQFLIPAQFRFYTCKLVTAKFVRLNNGKSGSGILFNATQKVQRTVFVLLVVCSQFLVEFFAWRSVNSSLAAGNYSVHNFYAAVLNLLNVSAELVCTALNNVLLVSTGLGTAGLGLGLGRPSLDNITAEYHG
jgi:hypothetical protein